MTWLINHFRSNLVGYLALIIATAGTSYAVTELPRNSVGTRQLQSDAVTTPKLHDHAVSAPKIKPGVVPQTTSLLTSVGFAGPVGDPVATPDNPALYHPLTFTLPTAGRAAITAIIASITQSCSSGFATAGLYVDGLPVPQTRTNLSNLAFFDGHGTAGQVFAATVRLSAGDHDANIGVDCASGDLSSSVDGDVAWTVTVSR
jgi:prepilin-type processing-associated H-X9-DG protein